MSIVVAVQPANIEAPSNNEMLNVQRLLSANCLAVTKPDPLKLLKDVFNRLPVEPY